MDELVPIDVVVGRRQVRLDEAAACNVYARNGELRLVAQRWRAMSGPGTLLVARRFLDPEEAERPYRSLLWGQLSLRRAIQSPLDLFVDEGTLDLPTLAARLLWQVNRIPFRGNKAASIALADDFLALNAHRLEGDSDALFELTRDVAWGRICEADAADGLCGLVVKGRPDAWFERRYPSVIERLAVA